MRAFILSVFLLGSIYLVPSSASAATLTIKNCGYKAVDVVAYNDNDTAQIFGASSARIGVGQSKSVHCRTSRCHIKINGIKADKNYSRPFAGGSHYVFWEHSDPNPRLFPGHECRMAKAPVKGKLHVKNCTKQTIKLFSYNGTDGSMAVAYSHAVIAPNQIGMVTCATEYCHLKLDNYQLYKHTGSVRIERPYARPFVLTGHTCGAK